MLIEQLPLNKIRYTPEAGKKIDQTYTAPHIIRPPTIEFGGFPLEPIYVPPTADLIHQEDLYIRLDDMCSKYVPGKEMGVAFIHEGVQLLLESTMLPDTVSQDTIKHIQKRIFDTTRTHSTSDKSSSKELTGIIREANTVITALEAGYDVYRPDEDMDKMGLDFIMIKDGKGFAIDVKPYGYWQKSSKRYQRQIIRVPVEPMPKNAHSQHSRYMFYEFPINKTNYNDLPSHIVRQLDFALETIGVTVNLLQQSSNPSQSSHKALYYSLRLREEAA